MKDAGVDADADARWVRIRIGPIPFAYPNTKARKRLVLAHDLQHLLTGYGTDLIGEAELGAWELGTGVRDRSGCVMRSACSGSCCRARLRDCAERSCVGATAGTCLGIGSTPPRCRARSPTCAENSGSIEPFPDATAEDLREWRRWAAKAIAVVWGPIIPIAAITWWWLS